MILLVNDDKTAPKGTGFEICKMIVRKLTIIPHAVVI
jgi:hypothetical protein